MEGSTGGGSQMPIPGGQILPQLIMEAKATSGLDIHHEGEESDEQKVKDMIENYTSHLFQQQKQKATAASQQFRSFMPSGPPPGPPPTSHSHPCLFTIDGSRHNGKSSDDFRQSPFNSGDQNQFYEAKTYTNGGPIFYQEAPPMNTTPPNTIMIKMSELTLLKNDNDILKKKNDTLEQKIGRLRQLEQAYDRIEKEFEQVLNQREQQEKIEKMALNKMEQHIQRLTAENSALIQRLETLSNSNISQGSLPPQQDNMQLAQLTMLLNEYVAQNKELQSTNDRQKIEIEAQSVTLTEQTNHIVMLEKALSNAQERLSAKDRQLMDSNALVEKYNHLQKLLQDSIEDKQRRHEEYMKEKNQLEMELTFAKMQKDNPSSRKNRTSPEPEDSSRMRRVIASKDEKIVQLEATILQLQKKYAEDNHKREIMLKAEVENLNARYRKLELEKLEKDRRMQELLNDNRRLHEQLLEERHTMDRRFSLLEENVRRLAVGRASTSSSPLYNNSPPISMTKQYQVAGFTPMAGALSVSSLPQFDRDPVFTRQRNFSVDPAAKMEEMRRNIADRRNNQPRSLSKPRMAPQMQMQNVHGSSNSSGHYRASSGPSSVIHSTKLNDYENQAEMEKKIADYMANLPPATRRRFAVATGLTDKDFQQNYQVHNATPSLPEGAKLPLSRQISKGSSASSSSKRQITPLTPTDPSSSSNKEKDAAIRIHLIEPSTDKKIESDDSEELNSRSGSSTTPSEPDEPQTPASGVSAASFSSNQLRNTPIYSYEVQPPQSITQIHTTTVVEVNKEQLGEKIKKNQRSLNHQPSSDPMRGGSSESPR